MLIGRLTVSGLGTSLAGLMSSFIGDRAGLVASALPVAGSIGATLALVFAIVARPRIRPIVLLVPAALLAVCGLYIVVEQYRYRYPPVFEWPTVFPRARTLAWIAVVLLAADALVEIVRSRPGPRGGTRSPGEARGEREPGPDPDTA